MDSYRLLADQVAADIAAGELRPGENLPTQREFARRHDIATSTASRVYRELARRGLVVGEVGRGTFVRATTPTVDPALTEPTARLVDLEMNFPTLPEQATLVARILAPLQRPDVLEAALAPSSVYGTAATREAVASLVARDDWSPGPESIVLTGSGRQALAASIATLMRSGERLGVEAMTYPVVRGIAQRLGVELVPIDCDDQGLRPDRLAAAHRRMKLTAIYVQPTLQNPLGTTMSHERRREIVTQLRNLDLFAVEDHVYGFLDPAPTPLASMAPERTIVVDSLSKRVCPGLTLGFAVTPPDLTRQVAVAVRAGAWTASSFAVHVTTRLMTSGVVDELVRGKRADAGRRQVLVSTHLGDYDIAADDKSYHCWWLLPAPWRAETFVAAAARAGIAVTPAAAFSTASGASPSAVRLALSSPTPEQLDRALATLGELCRQGPEQSTSH